MMDLDSAIQHCEEVAKEQESHGYCDRSLCVIMDVNNATCDECEAVKCRECASEHRQLAEWLKELKAYRETWSKLGMWLADTRLAIAPDEFLNDVDEELVRVAQVDMIDTVLEWMDKQEVSQE